MRLKNKTRKKRNFSASEVFARTQNRHEQEALYRTLHQMNKDRAVRLEDIFREKLFLGLRREMYKSSTGNSFWERGNFVDYNEKDVPEHRDYFSRWVLSLNDASHSLPQKEQLHFHNIQQRKLWLRWESNRCASAPSQRTKDRDVSKTAQDISTEGPTCSKHDTVRRKRQNFSDCAYVSHCSGNLSNKRHNKCRHQWVPEHGTKLNGFTSNFPETHSSKTCVSPKQSAKRKQHSITGPVNAIGKLGFTGNKPSWTETFGKHVQRSKKYEAMTSSESTESKRVAKGLPLRNGDNRLTPEKDWSDFGLNLFPDVSKQDSRQNNSQVKLSTTRNMWVRLRQKRVKPKSPVSGSSRHVTEVIDRPLTVEGLTRELRDKMADEKMATGEEGPPYSNSSVDSFVFHRGCKIHHYIRPQDRYKVDPLGVERSGQLFGKMQSCRHSSTYHREDNNPTPSFAIPARAKALNRLVQENQSMKVNCVRNTTYFEQELLDAKVRNFIENVACFSRSQIQLKLDPKES